MSFPPTGATPPVTTGNWLILRATYVDEDGDITKDSNSCLLTYELQEMTAGLKVLDAGIPGPGMKAALLSPTSPSRPRPKERAFCGGVLLSAQHHGRGRHR